MNYLAHILLSGDDEFIKIGNFMADSIKGNSYKKYPIEIQYGIILHRLIDSFTDSHPTYRKSKHKLHSKYGHFSGIITDIFYDHFLAKNWHLYSKKELTKYCSDFYSILNKHHNILTDNVKNFMKYMINENWLENYANIDGIEKTMIRMDYKTKNISKMSESIVELHQFYPLFEGEFTTFFDELRIYCKNYLTNKQIIII